MNASSFLSMVICSVFVSFSSRGQTPSISLPPKDSLLTAGITAYVDGRYQDAIVALTGLSDSSAQAGYYLGSAYAALGDNQAAAPVLNRAVSLAPGQASYRVQLARILLQTGKAVEAEKEYRRVLALDSLNLASLTGLGAMLLDRHAYRDGATLLAKAAAVNPRNALIYYQLGSSMIHLGQPDSAREYLSTSLALNRGYVPALTLLGSLYFEKNGYNDALRMYTAAAEHNPFSADLWYKVGLCQEKLDDVVAARKSFLKAADLDSLFEYAFAHLGQACYKLDMLDSAVAAYKRAIAIDKENALCYINMAIAWARMDSVEQAARSYRSAIGVMRPEQIGQVYERLGNLRFSKRQYRQARDAYLKAIEFDSHSGTIPYSLALAHDHLKQYKSAVTWYKKFLRTASGDPGMAKQVKEAKARVKLLEPRVAKSL